MRSVRASLERVFPSRNAPERGLELYNNHSWFVYARSSPRARVLPHFWFSNFVFQAL